MRQTIGPVWCFSTSSGFIFSFLLIHNIHRIYTCVECSSTTRVVIFLFWVGLFECLGQQVGKYTAPQNMRLCKISRR